MNTDSGPVCLIKASGIYIVVMASAWPIPNAELVSRHRTWGAAKEARDGLLRGRREASRKKPPVTSTWI